jgi:hypothetical protein
LLLAVILAASGAPAAAQTRAADRWQIKLDGGEYFWDLHVDSLRADSLVVRQADSAFTVPVLAMRELRLIRKSTMRLGDDGGGAATVRALTGGDDEVYDLGGLELRSGLVPEFWPATPPAIRGSTGIPGDDGGYRPDAASRLPSSGGSIRCSRRVPPTETC